MLPLRSDIPEISKFTYYAIDENFYDRSVENQKKYKGFCVIAGENYAQGSIREHAALRLGCWDKSLLSPNPMLALAGKI